MMLMAVDRLRTERIAARAAATRVRPPLTGDAATHLGATCENRDGNPSEAMIKREPTRQ
jgi:hypothetical protein